MLLILKAISRVKKKNSCEKEQENWKNEKILVFNRNRKNNKEITISERINFSYFIELKYILLFYKILKYKIFLRI